MLRHTGYVELPAHRGAGGFDHAAVHARTGRVYVAHTANDAIDVIDGAAGKYIGSLGGLTAVAGALVSDEQDRVFTPHRRENTIGLLSPAPVDRVGQGPVGVAPAGSGAHPFRPPADLDLPPGLAGVRVGGPEPRPVAGAEEPA